MYVLRTYDTTGAKGIGGPEIEGAVVTRKQKEAMDYLKANFDLIAREPSTPWGNRPGGVAFRTGLNTRVLAALERDGHIKGDVYLGGIVVNLEIVQGGK